MTSPTFLLNLNCVKLIILTVRGIIDVLNDEINDNYEEKY